MNPNQIIGVDFGSDRIMALAAEFQKDDSVKILAEESKPSSDTRHGIIEQVSGAAFKLNELARLLQNKAKIHEINRMSTSVGAKSMKSYLFSVSRFTGHSKIVTKKLMDEMTEECEKKFRLQGVEVFEIFPISYELDGEFVAKPENAKAVQIKTEYNVVVGNPVIKLKLDGCFDRSGIILETRIISPVAFATAVTEDSDRIDGCAVISFGNSTTILAIYYDDILLNTLVVPLGGRNISKDIEELGISYTNAERLKLVKGCALERLVEKPVSVRISALQPDESPVNISTDFLATIIEARLDEIFQPILPVIEEYKEYINCGIVLTGGASKLNGITAYVTEKTGIEARPGDHSGWLSNDTDPRYFEPAYSEVIGTILMTRDFRDKHPVTIPPKEPKIKKTIKERVEHKIMNFFNDENLMDDHQRPPKGNDNI